MRLFEGTPFDIPPTCDRCNALLADCKCAPLPEEEAPRVPPSKQTATVSLQKRKYGKQVTCVIGLDLRDAREVLVSLKNKLGTGGTVKDEVVEVQGAHVDKAARVLEEIGYRVKRK